MKPKSVGLDENTFMLLTSLSRELRLPKSVTVHLALLFLRCIVKREVARRELEKLITARNVRELIPEDVDHIVLTCAPAITVLETELRKIRETLDELRRSLTSAGRLEMKIEPWREERNMSDMGIVEALEPEQEKLPEFMRGNEWIRIIRSKYANP